MSEDELLHNMSRVFWASNGGSDNSMRAVLDVLQKSGYRRCAEGQRVTQWCDRAEKAEAEVERLRNGIAAVSALIADSSGVYGLHLNGDPAPWDELLSGGRFEEWLADFDEARGES